MLAIVAPHADNFRRPHRRQQHRFFQRDLLDPPRAHAFQVAVRLFRRRQQNPQNCVPPRHRLNQPVVCLTIPLKPTIFHRHLSNHETANSREKFPTPAQARQPKPEARPYGTVSLASPDRALSFPRTSTADTEYKYVFPAATFASRYAGVFTNSRFTFTATPPASRRYTL